MATVKLRFNSKPGGTSSPTSKDYNDAKKGREVLASQVLIRRRSRGVHRSAWAVFREEQDVRAWNDIREAILCAFAGQHHRGRSGMQSRAPAAEANLDIHRIENMDTSPLSVTSANAGPGVLGACCAVCDYPCREAERWATGC